MNPVLKHIATAVLGDYSFFRIYRADASNFAARPDSVDQEAIVVCKPLACLRTMTDSRHRELSALTDYAADEAYCYAAYADGELCAACWYWFGQTYRTKRGFLSIDSDEAKLVEIVTAPAYRGRGIATRLIRQSSEDMFRRGFQRLYARVWPTNAGSCRAFERAQWRFVAFVADVHLLGRKKPTRLHIRRAAT